MKKLFLITLGAVLISFSVTAQKLTEAKVPAVVKASFAKQFPKATDVKWEKEGLTYEVACKMDGKEMTVGLDAKGALIETEAGIPTTELPAAVAKAVAEKFKGQKIISVDKINAGTKVTYEVMVKKGEGQVFDPSGKYMGKVKD
jgi:uncharacterized membrane protein YkoI